MFTISPYYLVIVASLVIIISYFFNIFSKKTNIPSVLMLIILGVLIKQGLNYFDMGNMDFFPILEVLGIVGLIMIVLEAALDLELKKEKFSIIGKSMGVALFGLVGCTFAAGAIIHYLVIPQYPFFDALVYAVPLSIMSSAIIIPSIGGLEKSKKEFMVYESTFSDILGIMFFYFLVGNADAQSAGKVVSDIAINIIITIALSVIISYILVLIFQNLTTHVKLFLLISVLLLLYSIGKLNHFSSLIIILIFGLIINNNKVFFKGKLARYLKVDAINDILKNFKLITIESAFVIRTFFFVFFGIFITLSSLYDINVALNSLVLIASIYIVRAIVLKIFVRRDFGSILFIAPRGLITILLFFDIPQEYQHNDSFDSGILLYSIFVSSVIMMFALLRLGNKLEPVDKMELFDDADYYNATEQQ